MQPDKIISLLIDLQEKADTHTTEYLRLQYLPGNKAKATAHQRKALKLRTRILDLIRKIALAEGEDASHVFEPKESGNAQAGKPDTSAA